MSAFDDLAGTREDLHRILDDVLGAVLGEDARPAGDRRPAGPLVWARVAIHDEVDACHATVEVRMGAALARSLASRMLYVADPAPDDVLDAVAELVNIAGGNVKSALCRHARLSLPTAELTAGPPGGEAGPVTVRALVLGHVAELAVTPRAEVDDFVWPPATLDDTLERHA